MKLGTALAAALAASTLACASTSAGDSAEIEHATLGVTTEAPSEELARELGLEHRVRYRGRVVDSVVPGSAAAQAGLAPGDVLLALDAVELFSQDDIDDVLRVQRPGQTVTLTFQRAHARDERSARATLGGERGPPRAGIAWRHASLANLPRALEEARAQERLVLVGLSGAET